MFEVFILFRKEQKISRYILVLLIYYYLFCNCIKVDAIPRPNYFLVFDKYDFPGGAYVLSSCNYTLNSYNGVAFWFLLFLGRGRPLIDIVKIL